MAFPNALQVAVKPPMAVTNAVSWRSEGIKYKKNEVFLDVVESVNLLVNSNGTVVRSEVVGALKMRTFLSGMPECKLGLNDKVHHATCRNSGICGCCRHLVFSLLLAYCCCCRSESCMHDYSLLPATHFLPEAQCVSSRHKHQGMSVCVQVLFEAQGRGGKSKAVDLEDMKFHQCVRLARFENDRTISFIPPDGAFDLM